MQHGRFSDRVYVMKLEAGAAPAVLARVDDLAERHGYGKIVAKCPTTVVPELLARGYRVEAEVPRLFGPEEDGAFVGRFLDAERAVDPRMDQVRDVLERARASRCRERSDDGGRGTPVASGDASRRAAEGASAPTEIREAGPADAESLSACYAQVFDSYPFPIDDPVHLREAMEVGTRFFAAWHDGTVVAASWMEDGGTRVASR